MAVLFLNEIKNLSLNYLSSILKYFSIYYFKYTLYYRRFKAIYPAYFFYKKSLLWNTHKEIPVF